MRVVLVLLLTALLGSAGCVLTWPDLDEPDAGLTDGGAGDARGGDAEADSAWR